jgi:hypothetical protein
MAPGRRFAVAAVIVATLLAGEAGAQQSGLCTRPSPLLTCRRYVDLEFQAGTRWAAGVVAMRNVSDSIGVGISVLAMIHERSPGGLAIEARRRRWYARNAAIDLAAGPLWTQPGAGGRFPLLPNGVVAGVNLMHSDHFGVFGRLSHMRRPNEDPETRVGFGVQAGSRAGLPVLAAAVVAALLLIRAVGD